MEIIIPASSVDCVHLHRTEAQFRGSGWSQRSSITKPFPVSSAHSIAHYRFAHSVKKDPLTLLEVKRQIKFGPSSWGTHSMSGGCSIKWGKSKLVNTLVTSWSIVGAHSKGPPLPKRVGKSFVGMMVDLWLCLVHKGAGMGDEAA